jgi:yeast amino acid transporter
LFSALDGKAPKILTRCTKSGVPFYSVGVVLVISLLSFLQVSNNAAVVLQWFVSLVTASQLINFSIISFTFIKFKKALEVQGISRDSLPHKGFWQPYTAWYSFTCTTVMCFVGGYTVFLPGNWDVPTFLFSYLMVIVVPVLFCAWKIIHKTKWRRSEDIDLLKDKEGIDEYERNYIPTPPR